jgi:fatty acid-binding protein DegV
MRLIEEGADAIVSIHLSSKLSGTYQSAWIARETLPDEVKKIPLELVDSQSASIGVRNTITWFREPLSSQTRECWHSVNLFLCQFC